MAERHRQERLDNGERHRLKKRRLNYVSVFERQRIVNRVLEDKCKHEDVAQEFLVSVRAVSSLLKQIKADPFLFNKKQQKDEAARYKRRCVEQAVKGFHVLKVPVTSAN